MVLASSASSGAHPAYQLQELSMPVIKKEIGTGLTKRFSLSISGPWGKEERDAIRRMAEGFNNNTLEKNIASCEVFCQNVLDKANLPPWGTIVHVYADGNWTEDLPKGGTRGLQPGEAITSAGLLAESRYGIDSEQWFACQILDAIDVVRRAIASQDATKTARAALSLGELNTLAVLKFVWEPNALLGQKIRKQQQNRNNKSAQKRGRGQQERRNEVRKAADEIWKHHSGWTISAVAKYLARTRHENEHTLRGDLSKPEEWSTTFKPRRQKPDLLRGHQSLPLGNLP
jgi:hypothetical protein